MKNIKSFIAVLMCILTFLLPACKSVDSAAELKIGINDIEGVFNPFYSASEGDKEIATQMYRSIQRIDGDNNFVNYGGGISYKYVGDSQIEYTVSISSGLRFSNGKNITIDDVIFFYYFISDASYDGVYSDFYLNDIVGLKEFYFDDINYAKSVAAIEEKIKNNYTLTTIETADYAKYLAATSLEGKFDGNLDSASPYGAKWREYLLQHGYEEAVKDLGNNPSSEAVVGIVSKAEAETNPFAYNPENWYREKLYTEYLADNYADGADVERIEGIKKVNDYTCTVLFNSRNINAVAALNALLVSKEYFSAEYIKGSAEKVKELSGSEVCSGPYVLSGYDEESATMSANKYFGENTCEFSMLKFVEIQEDDNPTDLVSSGKIDVVSSLATAEVVDSLKNENVKYFIEDKNSYVSLFFNTRTLDSSARKALLGLCNLNSALESNIGSYYTRPLRPISVRFDEYPTSVTEPYYGESAFTVYSMGKNEKISDVTVYFEGSEGDLVHSALLRYKDILAEKGINLKIVPADEQSISAAIISGKADMWIEDVSDGYSCDKYEYYNSVGKYNRTGISTPEIDSLTSLIRSATGYSDKAKMTAQLMELVMEQAVECPLYQLQEITVYNTDTVSPDSFDRAVNMDGYTYYIPLLKKNR